MKQYTEINDSWELCPKCFMFEVKMVYKFSLNDAHEDYDSTQVYQCPNCKIIFDINTLWDEWLVRRSSLTQPSKPTTQSIKDLEQEGKK